MTPMGRRRSSTTGRHPIRCPIINRTTLAISSSGRAHNTSRRMIDVSATLAAGTWRAASPAAASDVCSSRESPARAYTVQVAMGPPAYDQSKHRAVPYTAMTRVSAQTLRSRGRATQDVRECVHAVDRREDPLDTLPASDDDAVELARRHHPRGLVQRGLGPEVFGWAHHARDLDAGELHADQRLDDRDVAFRHHPDQAVAIDHGEMPDQVTAHQLLRACEALGRRHRVGLARHVAIDRGHQHERGCCSGCAYRAVWQL